MRKKAVDIVPIRSFANKLSTTKTAQFEINLIEETQEQKTVHVEAHRHNYYHILYIENGNGIHIIDFETYEIKPNSLFFVSPGQVHSLEIDHRAKAYVITFNADFILLNNNIQRLLDFPFFHSIKNAPFLHLPPSEMKIKRTVDDIYEEFQAVQNGEENLLKSLLEVLLIRASRLYDEAIINKPPSDLTYQLRKLDALIDTHFKEYKQLNDYAEMMYISPKHLNSLCKKGLNKTVTNLIHERTIIEAKRLLLFTENSISEIAYELGFNEKSYFMRFFKKNTNITADSFRKQHRKSTDFK